MYSLSPRQKEIVSHINGPCLVLAGPGSGKTTVITKRLAYLGTNITDPSRLLSITFTRAAAYEMEKRYIKDNAKDKIPFFSTIHSLANKIIGDYEREKGIKIRRIEGQIKDRILNEVWDIVNPRLLRPKAEKLRRIISNREDDSGLVNKKELLYTYKKVKEERGYIDFDDMVALAKTILEEGGNLVLKWESKFDFIQVDEGQDLSKDQFDLIRILGKKENILIVADDDQSIYGFRGADPSLVLAFKDYYENAKILYLEENYRSDKRIVSLANNIIKRNKVRYDKNIFTRKKEGGHICFKSFGSLNRQAAYVVKKSASLVGKGKSVGILYRNNISSMIFEIYLKYYGISYSILGEAIDYLSDPFIRGFLKVLKKEEESSFFLIKSPSKVFSQLTKSGLYKEMETYYLGKSYPDYIYECIEAMAYLYKSYEEIREGMPLKDQEPSVCLTSIHSAKGLEFDSVFIVDLIQGDFPKREYLKGSALEEERRLFYVAITRAKSQLYLSFCQKRAYTYEEYSIFYKEAEEESKKKTQKL